MPETREFSTAALASLSTGIAMCKFDKIHEAAEFLMGHNIWTHHFASKELWEKIQEAILQQHPDLPSIIDDAENWQKILADLERKVGTKLSIEKGSGATAIHPLNMPT